MIDLNCAAAGSMWTDLKQVGALSFGIVKRQVPFVFSPIDRYPRTCKIHRQ